METLQMYRYPPRPERVNLKRKFRALTLSNATTLVDHQNHSANLFSSQPQWTKKIKTDDCSASHFQNDILGTQSKASLNSLGPQEERRLNIEDLPPEMLLEVLSKLNPVDLANCRKVCWRWNDASNYLLSSAGAATYRRRPDSQLLELQFVVCCNL